ncbi:UPF0386 protein YjhX 2 [Brucella endophytica]|uniref:UPF0386 protein GCM10011491_36510 n=2 Tax=Brucella endophytica TaxID=1963359 RepID=A0A916SK99_9HYPH|nr:UPF0386 protein YjhX 2 [Brucella endophytica]
MVSIQALTTMNISRIEQRVLHVLAQGGYIRHLREDGRITEIECFTREGYVLADCTMAVFQQLRRKRLIESRSGGPYRISMQGRLNVRAQANNR